MKKQVLTTLTMLSFLLLTALTVSAQSERIRVISIPFSFVVGHKTLPAGNYSLEPNKKDSNNVWLLQSKAGHTTALFITMAVRANETQEEVRVVFHKYGDRYFLSQIWTPGANTGRELSMPRLERQLARNVVAERMVVLTRVEPR